MLQSKIYFTFNSLALAEFSILSTFGRITVSFNYNNVGKSLFLNKIFFWYCLLFGLTKISLQSHHLKDMKAMFWKINPPET